MHHLHQRRTLTLDRLSLGELVGLLERMQSASLARLDLYDAAIDRTGALCDEARGVWDALCMGRLLHDCDICEAAMTLGDDAATRGLAGVATREMLERVATLVDEEARLDATERWLVGWAVRLGNIG